MFRRSKKQYAQAGVDYVLIFFLVTAAVLAMSTYVNRAIHGRHLMVRGFMYDQVNAVFQDTTLNLYGNFVRGYDPYYLKVENERRQDSVIVDTLQAGVYGGTVPIAKKEYLNYETGADSFSNQLPPKFAN